MNGQVRFSASGRVATRRQPDPQAVAVTWLYDVRRPYAVIVQMLTRTGPVRWMFARELLADGRLGVEGPGGAVVVSPAADESEVLIDLSSPAGRALLWTDAAVVSRFLNATYRLVPAGTESARIDWDRVVGDVLNRGLF
jgi:hypothetical protein